MNLKQLAGVLMFIGLAHAAAPSRVDVGGPYYVAYGDDLILEGTAITDSCVYTNLVYDWDLDGDGMDDGWELATFTNTVTAGVQTDFDLDGQWDLFEYRSGTQATNASSVLRLQANNAHGQLQWPTVPGRTYTVQFRPIPVSGSWTDLATGLTTGSFLDPDTNRVQQAGGMYRVSTP